jgi:hypothetical protein
MYSRVSFGLMNIRKRRYAVCKSNALAGTESIQRLKKRSLLNYT